MNPKILLSCLMAAGLVFAASSLQAVDANNSGPKPENKTPGQAPEGKRKEMAELKKKFDVNGDGKLDETERKAAREAIKNNPEFQKMREERMKKFDTNGDGKLDDAEKAAAESAMKERMAGGKEKLIEKFDTNGDGQLDEAEKAAAKAEMEKIKGAQGGPGAKAPEKKPPTS
jgi:Ca2+-binding EF-hand superfamily protein